MKNSFVPRWPSDNGSNKEKCWFNVSNSTTNAQRRGFGEFFFLFDARKIELKLNFFPMLRVRRKHMCTKNHFKRSFIRFHPQHRTILRLTMQHRRHTVMNVKVSFEGFLINYDRRIFYEAFNGPAPFDDSVRFGQLFRNIRNFCGLLRKSWKSANF